MKCEELIFGLSFSSSSIFCGDGLFVAPRARPTELIGSSATLYIYGYVNVYVYTYQYNTPSFLIFIYTYGQSTVSD